jgi:nitrite reductase (NADH) large subunit
MRRTFYRRKGVARSTGLGIKLEKFTWGCWTPHKVKLGVSGCPRNCAEATVKDIGIVCVDSGYEFHIGGAAGLEVKQTVLLCKLETEEEVLEYAGALMQLYREQAHYLDRIHKWLNRVGLETVKQQIVEDHERRRALFARFVFAQKFAQVDPWAERVNGAFAHEFKPLADLCIAQAAE